MSSFLWLVALYLIGRWSWRRFQKKSPTAATSPLEEAARRVLGNETGDFVADKIRGPIAVRNLILGGGMWLLGIGGIFSSIGFFLAAIMAPQTSLFLVFPGLLLLGGGIWLFRASKTMWSEAITDISRDFSVTRETSTITTPATPIAERRAAKQKLAAPMHPPASTKSSIPGTLEAANQSHKPQPKRKSKDTQFREL